MTGADRERRLRRGGLSFFGRITASIAHEINNVVSIISEVAGLLDDMCRLAEQGRPVDPQRLRRQCDRIARQIDRSKEIVAGMSQLAHSTDEASQLFDLERELRAGVALAGRLAGLKSYRLEVLPAVESAQVSGSRFILHELFFVLLSSIFDAGAKGGVIESRVERQEETARVVVAGDFEEGVAPDEGLVSYASLLAGELGGELELSRDGAGRVVFSVRLPASARA